MASIDFEKSTKPYLSPVAAIALSFGYAVGWGAFMMPGRAFLPGAGPLGTMDDLHALFS